MKTLTPLNQHNILLRAAPLRASYQSNRTKPPPAPFLRLSTRKMPFPAPKTGAGNGAASPVPPVNSSPVRLLCAHDKKRPAADTARSLPLLSKTMAGWGQGKLGRPKVTAWQSRTSPRNSRSLPLTQRHPFIGHHWRWGEKPWRTLWAMSPV